MTRDAGERDRDEPAEPDETAPEAAEATISEATKTRAKDDDRSKAGQADKPAKDADADADRERKRREAIKRVLEDSPRAERRRKEHEEPLDAEPPDDKRPGKWRRRLIVLLLLAVAAAVVWGLGLRNHERYFLVCSPDRVEPQRGTEWPWGRDPMPGEAFAAVKIPPDAECTTRELGSREQLEVALLDLLIARAETEMAQSAPKLDDINARVTQATHLVRGRPERRAKLARLSADLAYLRGQRGVEQAVAAVKAALAAFRDAQAQGATRGKDSEAWAQHLERVLLQLAAPRPPEPTPRAAPLPASRPASAPALPRPDPGAPVPPPPGGVLL
jgi:hypothetical protein